MLTLFAISPGGWVPKHHGQDPRINIHLCLLNCESSWIVAQGRRHEYKAGGLLAFDDPGDHEVHNDDQQAARVVLGLGVLHPSITPQHGPCFRSSKRQR